MTTKVKGLIKGLRYISQIFDEEKEAEIQIGFPTDVKHVAHIGWDGPAAADNPTWMQGFNGALKSAPLGGPPAESKDNPDIKWVSEDTRGRGGRSGSREAAEGQKSSGRHPSSGENDGGTGGSPKSSKPRQSRRHKSAAAADGTKSAATASDSSVPEVARKSRRKKSKDFTADGCSRSSRTCRSTAAPTTTPTPTPAASDADQGPSPQAQVQEELENC